MEHLSENDNIDDYSKYILEKKKWKFYYIIILLK